jgi:lipoprotein-anchoring transpeptidase ErfK/SrfK
VVVDSTERFGESDMRPGARGADARELQRRLREVGALKGRLTKVFDRRTAAALRAFQQDRRLAVTGVVDPPTRTALLGRIVVNIGQRKLRLIRGGKVVKTYGVAVGQPGHPTPTGTYEIVKMEKDPTWSPPDSPWAEGLGPIPPGPGNPLGTRWIGTSSPAIGIHGTYDDGSIGTAASHGCIRMHIPEVEQLYEQVALGMEVRFVA